MESDDQVITVVPLGELGEPGKTAIVSLCSEALAADCSTLFDHLSASTHVVAHIDSCLVGHACWTTRYLRPAGLPPVRTAWIDAVSVARAHQNRRIGTAVMRRLANETAGFQLCALGTEQVTFFERLGWERWHGTTDDVLHDPLDTLMIRRTATTPELDTKGPITAT